MPSPFIKRLWYALCITFSCGFAMIGAGCGSSQSQLQIEIPQAYQGVFMLLEDDGGKDDTLSGNTLVVRVPKNGIACIKNGAFLYDWHSTTVRYSDGQSIPFFDARGDKTDVALGCWGVMSMKKAEYYYVGPSNQRDRVRREDPVILRERFWLRPTNNTSSNVGEGNDKP
jgi:hypothetical protein